MKKNISLSDRHTKISILSLKAPCMLMAMLTVLTLLTMTVTAVNYPQPSDVFYVSDYANVIDTQTIEHIVEKNDILYEACGAQIVIVTVTGLGGESISRYTAGLFNDWGIGSAEKNNGILFLMSLGDDDYYCVQGKGLESILSSGEIGVLLDDYAEPAFAKGDYDGAALAFFDAVYAVLEKAYGITKSEAPNIISSEDNTREESSPHSLFRGISFFTVFAVIILFLVVRSLISGAVRFSRPRRSFFGGWYRPPRPPFGGFGPGPGPGRDSRRPPRSGGGFFSGGGSGFHSSGGFSQGSSRSGHSSSGRSSSSGPRSGGGGSTRGGGAGRGRR